MFINQATFGVDVLSKFFNTIRAEGWFYRPDDRLASVSVNGESVLGCVSAVGLPHGSVTHLGPDLGFNIQVLRSHEPISTEDALIFTTASGVVITAPLLDLCEDRRSFYPGGELTNRFINTVDAIPDAKVLDIGGRARSGIDKSQSFSSASVTVLDILTGENVDVVADAHDMTAVFPPDYFDAICSFSVFEHLLMPWAVVPQMNRIMKPGAIALIVTHQALGMHDMPWDFWRFSDTAWDALFNPRTGFEVLERVLDSSQYIIPFIYQPVKAWVERTCGFEGSYVLVRKTGPCTLSWPVTPADLTTTMYPGGIEDPYAKE